MSTDATIYIDGGSRGNPGPASYAVVLTREGLPTLEEANTLGKATNNVAEYTALVRALELAAANGVRQIQLFSDSELLVKQMNGVYKVKNADLQDLYREACELRRKFQKVTLQHVRRELNKRADFLCNEALDGRPRVAGEEPTIAELSTPKASRVEPAKTVGDDKVRDDAVDCLRAAAQSWADHGPRNPSAEQVWEQLWSILEEGGVLRKKK